MDGWVGGWMGRWMDGWMGGWMDRWIDGSIDRWLGANLLQYYISLFTSVEETLFIIEESICGESESWFVFSELRISSHQFMWL